MIAMVSYRIVSCLRNNGPTMPNGVAHQIRQITLLPTAGHPRKPRDLPCPLAPRRAFAFFALASFMQTLVGLANLTNERSVRRPQHALDPGHDLRMRRYP